MTITKVGDWAAARAATEAMGTRMVRATERATKQEAQLFRRMVVTAFNTRGKSNGTAWVPNKPSTRKQKGSSKPLIDSGQLRNSVQVVDRGGAIFVGIPNFARRKGGGPLVSIAAVHEYGKVIVQNRGGQVVLIKIPKRSFIQATADFHFSPAKVRTRFHARVAVGMGPGWAVQAPASARALAKEGKAVAAAKAAGKGEM